MSYIIVGLGNKGKEYEMTRHNVGRILVEKFRKKYDFPLWTEEKNRSFLISKGKIGTHTVTLILPELLMNKSGIAIKLLTASQKKGLIVVHDDIDLGFGQYKISFGRGSGGHKGVESIMRSIKTKNFERVRVGIAPMTRFGKIKKPKGEQKVIDFIMKSFNKKEQEVLTKLSRTINDILLTLIEKGKAITMNKYN